MPSRTTPIALAGIWGFFGFLGSLVFLGSGLLVPAALWAQGGPGGIPGDTFLNGGPSAESADAIGGGFDEGMDPGMISGGMYPGMQPGMHPGMHPGMYPGGFPGMHPGGYGGPAGLGPSHGAPPKNDWWPAPSFWTTFTKKVLPNSYVRFEFLNWNIEAPGDRIIGAEDFVVDLRAPALVGLDDGTIRMAHFPSAGEIDLKDTEGFRLTLGLPTRQGGALELSYWNLFEVEETYRDSRAGGIDPATGLPQVIAIPMHDQGGTGQNAIFFDRSWSADYTSDLSGLEVKCLYDYSPHGTGIYIQPLIGLRSNSVEEEFLLSGRTTIGGIRRARIHSETDNFIIGPQVGVRLELEWWTFRFGVEPRVGGGFNFYEAELNVADWRFPGDPSWSDDEHDVKFSGMFELGAYGKFEVHPNVTLFGGYNFLYLSRVSRPLENIYFNDVTAGGRPLIRLTPDHFDMSVEGLNVGAEIRWR